MPEKPGRAHAAGTRRGALDSEIASHLDRQESGLRQVHVKVGPVVEPVVTEVRASPGREILEYGAFLVVAEGDEILHLVGTTGNGQVGVDAAGETLGGQREPIVVRVTDGIYPGSRVFIFIDLPPRDHRSETQGVLLSDVEHLRRSGGRDVLREHSRKIHSVRHGGLHLWLSDRAGPCRDNDDTVGAFRSEHSGGGRVLQHGYGSDLVRVNVGEASLHTIHKHQRAGAVPTGDTADEYAHIIVARLTSVCDSDNTG